MEQEEKLNNLFVYVLLGLVVAVMLFFVLSNGNDLKGTWNLMGGKPGDGVSFDGEQVYLRDGYEVRVYNYTVSGDEVTMINDDRGETSVFAYKVSGNILTMTYLNNGSVLYFTKQ